MNYYLIPLCLGQDFFVGDKTLRDALKEGYPELDQAEKKRIDLLYSSSPIRDLPNYIEAQLIEHKMFTKDLYEKAQVPEYIIAEGYDDEVREIVSKITIKPKFSSALGVRRTTEEKAKEYFYSSNYYDKIINFLPFVNGTYERIVANVEKRYSTKYGLLTRVKKENTHN